MLPLVDNELFLVHKARVQRSERDFNLEFTLVQKLSDREKLLITLERKVERRRKEFSARCTRYRRGTFSENVCEQEAEEGNYEISFTVKRGHREVMSTVLRNY